MHEPIIALSKRIRSRATSSAGNAFPGLNGFAIIGCTSVRLSVSSIAYTASAPGEQRGYGRSPMPFARYLFNTALISSITVVGQLFSSSIVAYSLAKIRWRGRDALLLLIIATMMLPPQVTMIPVYIGWSKIGLTGSYLPLLIPQFFGSAFFIFMLRQFFRGIPEELLDAARVEGASDLRIYRSVVLPLARPAL